MWGHSPVLCEECDIKRREGAIRGQGLKLWGQAFEEESRRLEFPGRKAGPRIYNEAKGLSLRPSEAVSRAWSMEPLKAGAGGPRPFVAGDC